MPTTSYVEFTAAARGIGARTTSLGVAVDDISAEEDRLIHAILSEGALTDTAFLVTDGAGMNVVVGSGTAKADLFVIAGEVAGQGRYLVRLDAVNIAVAVPASDVSQTRIDQVYLIVADAPYDGGTVALPRIGYRKGDVGGAAPGADTAWKASALLATVTVPAGTTEIVAGNVVDGRTHAALSNGVPAGSMEMFLGAVAPTGWLIADGSAVSRTTYRRLFGVIGTTYGAGDGSTTFGLPDLRGRMPVGLKATDTAFDALGETGGAKTVTLTTAQLPVHTHAATQPTHSHALTIADGGYHAHNEWGDGSVVYVGGGSGSSPALTGWTQTGTTTTSGGHTHSGSSAAAASAGAIAVANAGTGETHENLPPYLAVNFIVKT